MKTLRQRLLSVVRPGPVVSVLRLYGAIGLGGPLGRGIDDESLAPLIERAFAPRRLKAVALAINSPGGSPAQSALIAARIRRLADERAVKVHAFCEDVAASGGYWLACAADQIWAEANAIVGSIGVVSASFGFQDAIARLGVERRVHTAGERKTLLDPFRPEDPADVERLKRIQKGVHDNFIAHVERARGDRLTGDRAALFSGDVWLAAEAQELGLIDGVGHLAPTMRRLYGEDVRFAVARPRKSLLQRLGAPGAAELLGAVEERALFARYGR
ncbi:MAG: S49 family peptidase [Rhodobacteraceae bacterium]|nr:MAG: S49 family peptidase [Paracoccaceae bacterium]